MSAAVGEGSGMMTAILERIDSAPGDRGALSRRFGVGTAEIISGPMPHRIDR